MSVPALALTGLLLLAACGTEPASTAPGGSGDPAATVAAGSGSDTSGSTASPSLFGPVWWLTGAVEDGEPVDVPDDGARSARFQFLRRYECFDGDYCTDGPYLIGNDACNDFERSVAIDDTTVTYGSYFFSTTAGCGGELADAMRACSARSRSTTP